MKFTQHHNYVAIYLDGFKIGRTGNVDRRKRELKGTCAFIAGKPVSALVALHTETHLRRVLKSFALPGSFEYFEASENEALEVIAFTDRTQNTFEEAGV